MHVKQGIAHFLEKHDIQHIFQIPGFHTVSLLETIGSSINTQIIGGRHESNTAFMADGYARSSGKPAVLLVTPGPGLGNVVSGCMEAFHDEVPILIVHIGVAKEDADKGALHGTFAPEDMFAGITKKVYSSDKADEVISTLDAALVRCLSGRNGPVLVSIPQKILEKEMAGESYAAAKPGDTASAAQKQGREFSTFLETISTLIEKAQCPVIICGGRCMSEVTANLLNNICNSASIPLLTTSHAKGMVPENNPWVFGNVMKPGLAKDIIAVSDLVIAAGTRLRQTDINRKALLSKPLIHIDIDEVWMDMNYPAAAKFSGNPEVALSSLGKLLNNKRFLWDRAELEKKKTAEESVLFANEPGYAFISALRRSIPNDTILVCDLNNLSYWAEYYFPVYHQRSFLMPRGVSSIFYAVPAAIGAKLANPGRPCLALCGDGGALPTLAELSTVKKYTIPVVILLENNDSFGVLESIAKNNDGKQMMGLTNPDFLRLADAFGIKAKRAVTIDELMKIFHDDVTWNEPFLIEFRRPVGGLPWKKR